MILNEMLISTYGNLGIYRLLTLLDRLDVIYMKQAVGHSAPPGTKTFLNKPLQIERHSMANCLKVTYYTSMKDNYVRL